MSFELDNDGIIEKNGIILNYFLKASDLDISFAKKVITLNNSIIAESEDIIKNGSDAEIKIIAKKTIETKLQENKKLENYIKQL